MEVSVGLVVRSVGRHRGWMIFLDSVSGQYTASMRLETSMAGVDLPDLEADVDEAMSSRLSAFQNVIRGGSAPRAMVGPEEKVTPTPAPKKAPKKKERKTRRGKRVRLVRQPGETSMQFRRRKIAQLRAR